MPEPATAAPPLRLRRLPLPRWEPPYDDEVGSADGASALGGPAQGPAHGGPAHDADAAGANPLPPGVPAGRGSAPPAPGVLALALPLEFPPPRATRPPLHVVPGTKARPEGDGTPRQVLGGDEDPDDAVPRTPRARLPEPRAWAGRFVQVLLEVLAGERPASQVMRHVSLAVYSDLVAAPPRASTGRARPASSAIVTSLRVTEPDDGVAEVCAVTRRGDRRRALALRLEGQGGRWRCVALEVG